MNLQFRPEAENVLFEIALWVEEHNTPGSGLRYASKFIDRIGAYAVPKATYAICHHSSLASMGLRCITIDDWVVAFHQTGSEFTVCYILHGSVLK